jgi:hypothetical protein
LRITTSVEPDPNHPNPEPAISIGGSLGPAGRVSINGGLARNLEIGGDITTTLWKSEAVLVREELTGQIRVNGTLHDDPNWPVEIQVGSISWPGAIAIDWDGYDPNDRWDSNAAIVVGDPNDPKMCTTTTGPLVGCMR